jgi:hypothetical protein
VLFVFGFVVQQLDQAAQCARRLDFSAMGDHERQVGVVLSECDQTLMYRVQNRKHLELQPARVHGR